jgi:hypothetical protein
VSIGRQTVFRNAEKEVFVETGEAILSPGFVEDADPFFMRFWTILIGISTTEKQSQ